MNTLVAPAICLVTDRRRLSPSARTLAAELSALEVFVDEAIAAGVDLIQIRERDVPARELAAHVARLVGRSGSGPTRILVNDRIDVALTGGAHGVHLRSDAPDTGRVRPLVGPAWIGRSHHDGDDEGRLSGTDFAIFGTVFATGSKPGRPPAGVARLRDAATRLRVPVLAIGGITPASARECRQAGAAGVAAIGLFLPEGREPGSIGARRAVAELRAAMTGASLNLLE